MEEEEGLSWTRACCLPRCSPRWHRRPHGPRPGPVWQEVARDHDAIYYWDPASLSRSGDNADFQMRAERHTAEADGGVTMLTRHRVDCERALMCVLAGAIYDSAGGLPRRGEAGAEDAPYPIEEGTGEARVRERACNIDPVTNAR